VSSSKSGPRTVNSVGKCHFGKWHLYTTDFSQDAWKKLVVDDEQGIIVPDSYIRIVRDNKNPANREYMIFFHGEARFLSEHFQRFKPEYEGPSSKLKFEDIQAAKDYVDQFIERLNNLLVFI